MRSFHRRGVVALIGVALLGLAACGQSAADNSAAGDTLVFAAVPSEESTSLQQSFAPIISMLEQETGTTIEFQNATDYAAVVEGMRAGQIDIAMYGPFSYVLAKEQDPEIAAVAAVIDEAGGQPGYVSYGITRPETGISDLAGFAGRTVCFVDPNSTSGYLYPTAGLIEAGVDVQDGLTPVFAGGHDASALAVASGQCDAGFAFDSIIDTQLVESGQLRPGQVQTVWRSETIAGSPIALASGMAPELRDRIGRALVERGNVDRLTAEGFCASADDCEVGEADSWGYAPVDDTLYDGVRRVCDITRAESCTSLG
ncbi:phosphate/phosphite/phosphonate ABC transporter substrate-binding protein [Pseudonocardia sp. HH130630-07]|uniref:phosphate/phosphite/phosphonate ABC transporter substrate-binding protein n=1 Tax=Pseudonocardia sp. HH130630-07 TaxID=1690815 RepID=UPI000814F42C|nr:phosphate/phosphite/phosphonate ABC transporter substrate-binding protein [Pseudonocardia sp. HH130630-07]ANY10739.1 phosphate starvation-inducible protein PhoH [Pseudonocardia sp. HH130630-07]